MEGSPPIPTVADSPSPAPHPASRAAPVRHLRWLVPLALALAVFLVVAVVEAVHQSHKMGGTAMIESAGFYTPSSTTPVPFSLPVLQAATADPSASAGAQPVTMGSLKGKPIVLNMWSSSCSVCKTETPAMESVARRVGGAVRFVGVDTIDQRPAAMQFLHRYRVSYLQLFDPGEHVGSGYAIPGLPVTIFVSAHGKVVGGYLGALSTTTLTHYLRSLFGVRVPST